MVLRFAAALLRGNQRTDGRTSWPSVMGEPILVPMLVVLAVVWLLPHNPYPTRLTTALTSQLLAYTPTIPSVHIDTHPTTTFQSRYPANKTALYIEPRADIPFMIPLLLHMMLVVPPDWRFVFFGSSATVQKVRDSHTASGYEALGKLHVRDLADTSWGLEWAKQGWEGGEGTLGTEEIQSRLLTNRTFYERELRGAEWLLVWHSDAILCANSEIGLDEWLGWDWVGAPWNDGRRYGGNGGLSIRKVSRVMEILEFQKRLDDSFPEDLWMSSRLETMPNAKMCPPDKAKEFAVADIWHNNPMGYHINQGALAEAVWKPIDRRRQIYEYCPDVKIILDMAMEREKCPEQMQTEQQESLMFKSAEDLRNSEQGQSEEAKQEEENKKAEEENKEKQKQKDEEMKRKKQKEKEMYEAAIAKHKHGKATSGGKKAAATAGLGNLTPGIPGLDDKAEAEKLGLLFDIPSAKQGDKELDLKKPEYNDNLGGTGGEDGDNNIFDHMGDQGKHDDKTDDKDLYDINDRNRNDDNKDNEKDDEDAENDDDRSATAKGAKSGELEEPADFEHNVEHDVSKDATKTSKDELDKLDGIESKEQKDDLVVDYDYSEIFASKSDASEKDRGADSQSADGKDSISADEDDRNSDSRGQDPESQDDVALALDQYRKRRIGRHH